jgi:hypothetical protein
MIKTYDLIIYFDGYSREFNNISRVAVGRYIEWYQEDGELYGYDLADSKLDRNGEDFA